MLMAQKFEKSIGVRLGYSKAVFLDIQNHDLSNYRFMISWREGGRQFSAMKYFQQFKLDKLPGYLSIYYGYGIHAGYSTWEQYKQDTEHGYYWEEISAPSFGLDGLIGLSYDFDRIPVSITCDAKPFFDLWGKSIFKAVPTDIGISAVYHF